MVIRVTDGLEMALIEQAARRGLTAEDTALSALRDRFLPNTTSFEPKDDWERRLFDAALDCGVSVPDWALSSDGLYE
jgi:hypothetical protein